MNALVEDIYIYIYIYNPTQRNNDEEEAFGKVASKRAEEWGLGFTSWIPD